jgi:hypothetical protein
MPIHLDEASSPIIVITMTGRLDQAELNDYYESFTTLMTRARRSGLMLGVVIDGRTTLPPGAVERRSISAFMGRNDRLMADTIFGEAIVLSNALQRGVLTALLWVRPLPMPYTVCATVQEGRTWLASRRAA